MDIDSIEYMIWYRIYLMDSDGSWWILESFTVSFFHPQIAALKKPTRPARQATAHGWSREAEAIDPRTNINIKIRLRFNILWYTMIYYNIIYCNIKPGLIVNIKKSYVPWFHFNGGGTIFFAGLPGTSLGIHRSSAMQLPYAVRHGGFSMANCSS